MGCRTLELTQTKMVFSIERALVTLYTQTHTQLSSVINNLPAAGVLTVKAKWIKKLPLVLLEILHIYTEYGDLLC